MTFNKIFIIWFTSSSLIARFTRILLIPLIAKNSLIFYESFERQSSFAT